MDKHNWAPRPEDRAAHGLSGVEVYTKQRASEAATTLRAENPHVLSRIFAKFRMTGSHASRSVRNALLAAGALSALNAIHPAEAEANPGINVYVSGGVGVNMPQMRMVGGTGRAAMPGQAVWPDGSPRYSGMGMGGSNMGYGGPMPPPPPNMRGYPQPQMAPPGYVYSGAPQYHPVNTPGVYGPNYNPDPRFAPPQMPWTGQPGYAPGYGGPEQYGSGQMPVAPMNNQPVMPPIPTQPPPQYIGQPVQQPPAPVVAPQAEDPMAVLKRMADQNRVQPTKSPLDERL